MCKNTLNIRLIWQDLEKLGKVMESHGIVTAQKSTLKWTPTQTNKLVAGWNISSFDLAKFAFIDVVWQWSFICHQPGTSNFKSNIVHFADFEYFKTVYLITVNLRFSLIWNSILTRKLVQCLIERLRSALSERTTWIQSFFQQYFRSTSFATGE